MAEEHPISQLVAPVAACKEPQFQENIGTVHQVTPSVACCNAVAACVCWFISRRSVSFSLSFLLQELDRIQNFLGLDQMHLKSTLPKIHTMSVEESLANYEEVAAELRGTSLEWMLTQEVP